MLVVCVFVCVDLGSCVCTLCCFVLLSCFALLMFDYVFVHVLTSSVFVLLFLFVFCCCSLFSRGLSVCVVVSLLLCVGCLCLFVLCS